MTDSLCALCPRRCHALRTQTRGEGRCHMGWQPVVARAALHWGEEPCISGSKGSGTVFFCGCAMGCVFCQNADISRDGRLGIALDPDALGEVFLSLRAQGAHNINLVSAGHFAPAVAEALKRHPPGIPVVYNSSGYESAQTLRLLDGLIDVYLPDFKYATARIARLCAQAPDYPQVALSAIQQMRLQTGPAVFDSDGLLLRGVMVRHLVLPSLTGASMRALTMLRDALPTDVRVSLMGQYTPCGQAQDIPGLDRPLLPREYRRVVDHMRLLGMDGYIQSLDASGPAMIPQWDRTGVSQYAGRAALSPAD